MKNTFPTARISYLVLLITLSNCYDHRLPGLLPGIPPDSSGVRLRVKTVQMELPGNLAKISSFSYDSQGRLSSIFTYQSPDSTVSELEYSTYEYDDTRNHLLKMRHELVTYPRPGPGISRPTETYFYDYSASDDQYGQFGYVKAGQLTRIRYSGGWIPSIREFRYDYNYKLISSRRSFPQEGLDIIGSDEFTFTGNDLTTQNTMDGINNRAMGYYTTLSVVHYTYDDKINPFYGTYVIPAPYPSGFFPRFYGVVLSPVKIDTYFGGIDNVLTLSQHNVVGVSTESLSTHTISSYTYQYQYNSAGLPTVRTVINSQGVPMRTLYFEYEPY